MVRPAATLRLGAVALAAAAGIASWVVTGSQAAPSGGDASGSAGSTAVSASQYEDGIYATPTTSVDAAQAQAFAVLDKPVTASDAVPSVEADGTDVLTEQFGANLALARRADGFSSGGAWVIPGDGYVCFLADPAYTSGASSAAGLEGGATCQTDADAAAGDVSLTGGDRPAGVYTVAGLVPDGVPSVKATVASGATEDLPVHENVYMAASSTPVSAVSFTAPGGAPVTISEGDG